MLLAAAELTSQLVWHWIEVRAFATRQATLANNAINFMLQADALYGYTLKPGEYTSVVVNGDGFAQRDRVPLPRPDDVLRLTALGESTSVAPASASGSAFERVRL